MLHAPPLVFTLYFFGITLFDILPIYGSVSSAGTPPTSIFFIGVAVGYLICGEYNCCFSGMQFGWQSQHLWVARINLVLDIRHICVLLFSIFDNHLVIVHPDLSFSAPNICLDAKKNIL